MAAVGHSVGDGPWCEERCWRVAMVLLIGHGVGDGSWCWHVGDGLRHWRGVNTVVLAMGYEVADRL